MRECDGKRGRKREAKGEGRRGTTRRGFLAGVGAAAGVAALRAGVAEAAGDSPAPGPDGGHDVIVVGGGFAGVTAARELQHAGLRTLILEARGRLGGRTFTAKFGDEHFDLGGTWVHWLQPNVWAEISRYGLEVAETPGAAPERALWWSGGAVHEAGIGAIAPLLGEALCGSGETPDVGVRTLGGLALTASAMSGFHDGAAKAFPRPMDPFFGDAWKAFDGLSVRDRLEQLAPSADRRAVLEGTLGGSCCGPFAECGFVEMLRWWALAGLDMQRYGDSVARFKLRDGTVSLLDAIVADGRPEVRLDSPVARIEQQGGEVRVTTAQGETFRARAVIAALPMNVLANVEFSPPLDPAKVAASRERHAGAGVKLYARVRGETPNFAAFAPESEPLQVMFTSEAGRDGGVLIAFGTSPEKIDAHSPAAVQDFVRRFLPGAEVTTSFAYDWHLDPYSLGTWCILRPGQMTKYLAKLREPAGLVHFAGGDFALGWRGFIDGAIESGGRVAHEVIARLRGAASAHASAGGSPRAGV